MFSKSKNKNRRLGRDYVLDVKLRSSQVRAARVRLAALSGAAIFGTIFGFYLLWRAADWGLNKFVYENRSFAIKEIDLQTDGTIATDQLKRWARVKMGENLMALDLSRVKRDLEMAPQVHSVSVERILPGTLRIRVEEREPIAQATVLRAEGGDRITNTVYTLDGEGWVMMPAEAKAASSKEGAGETTLTMITGLNSAELQPGRRIDSEQCRAALEFLRLFESSPAAKVVDVKRIDISSPEVLVVTTSQQGEITFRNTDLEQQILRWHEITLAGQRQGKALAWLDLAISNNIPARWIEASIVPPATPKPAKPLKIRKKTHV